MSFFRLLLVALCSSFTAACIISINNTVLADEQHEAFAYAEPFSGDLPDMRKRKLIRALVTYSQTDFFYDKGSPRGLQVSLLDEYLKFVNRNVRREENKVHIVYIPLPFNQLIPALLRGQGDIAAALLTITPQRENLVTFATGRKLEVAELVVSHKSVTGLTSIDDLSGKEVYVLSGSSYVQHLRALNKSFEARDMKPITIQNANSDLQSEDILELVNAGAVKITVIDDYQARLWQKVLPDIRVHEGLKVAEGNHVGWAIRNHSPELAESLDAFAQTVRKGTLLGNMLFKRFYANTRWISNPLSKKELAKLDSKLELFRKYGRQYGIDYWALVAQAFQESRLNNAKRSSRGAIGIMQVLPSTAGDPNVAVKNITVLENNIHAAAKYLAFLRDRYFSDTAITAANRQAFSWAAYNAGPANVRRFRDQASKLGLDPDVWFSNVEIAASKNGRETVQYVAHVHKYYISYKLASKAIKDEATLISETPAARERLLANYRHHKQAANPDNQPQYGTMMNAHKGTGALAQVFPVTTIQ